MGAQAVQLNPSLRSVESQDFEEGLRRKIVGQDEAVQAVVDLYQVFRAGLNSPGRPIGNLLFLGPTGAGKTRVVEATAEVLFGGSRAVIKVDCAEYQHSHEIAKLIRTAHSSSAGEFAWTEQVCPGDVISIRWSDGERALTKITLEDAFGSDDKVVVRWSAVMTHTRDRLGMAATNKKVRITGITIARIEKGKIVQGWDNWDQLALMQQVSSTVAVP